jgi:hypothetical protein
MSVIKDENWLFKIEKSIGNKMDEIEAKMVANNDLLVFPLIHRFTDGLYTREMCIDANVLITTKTHLVQHQFFLLEGKMLIWNNDGEAIYLQAPYIGITEVNTRRLIYAIEDCVFATCHPNPNNDIVEDIEKIIFEDYDNNLLTEDMKAKIKETQLLSKKESYILDECSKSINN